MTRRQLRDLGFIQANTINPGYYYHVSNDRLTIHIPNLAKTTPEKLIMKFYSVIWNEAYKIGDRDRQNKIRNVLNGLL